MLEAICSTEGAEVTTVESILTSIKKLLGITEDYEHFDGELMIHINSVFAVLNQLGVGPNAGFVIADKSFVWKDFLNDDKTLEFVKTFVYLKVRLLFDPPQSAAVIEAINRQASEYEWRILVAADLDGNKYIE